MMLLIQFDAPDPMMAITFHHHHKGKVGQDQNKGAMMGLMFVKLFAPELCEITLIRG